MSSWDNTTLLSPSAFDGSDGRKYSTTSTPANTRALLGLTTPASKRFLPAGKFTTPQAQQHPQFPPVQKASEAAPTLLNEFLNADGLVDKGAEPVSMVDVIIQGLHITGPLLPSRRYLIQRIFLSVDHAKDLQVSSAALRALTFLSDLPQFEPSPLLNAVAPNRLYAAVAEEAEVLEAALSQFRRRLEREETEVCDQLVPEQLSQLHHYLLQLSLFQVTEGDVFESILANDAFVDAFGLTNIIRLQIVMYFTRNVAKSSYNMAHHLLGFTTEEGDMEIDERKGCLSLLIDMLEYGLGHPSTHAPVIFLEHPTLAIAILHLLYDLCSSSSLIGRTARVYLRDRRQIFLKLAAFINTKPLADASSAAEQRLEFELLQKAHLLSLLAADLHDAMLFSDEQRYSENLIRLLAFTHEFSLADANLAASATDEVKFIIGEEAKCVEMLSIIHAKSCHLPAASEFIVAWSSLVCEILIVLDESRKANSSLLSLAFSIPSTMTFLSSLQSRLFNTLRLPDLSVKAIDGLVQVALMAASSQLSETYAPGDLIDVVLRHDAQLSTRCMLYSVFISGNLEKLLADLADERLEALILALVKDCSNTAGNDPISNSLQCVVLSTLQCLYACRPTRLLECLSSNGFFASFSHSLLLDDQALCDLLSSSSAQIGELSILLKWRAKWTFLQDLISSNSDESFIVDYLIETAGLFDLVLAKMRCLSAATVFHYHNQSQLLTDALLPLFKFLVALLVGNGRNVQVANRLWRIWAQSDVIDGFIFLLSASYSDLQSMQFLQTAMVLLNSSLISCPFDVIPSGKINALCQGIISQMIASIWLWHESGHGITATALLADWSECRALSSLLVNILHECVDFLASVSTDDILTDDFSVIPKDKAKHSGVRISSGTTVFLMQTAMTRLRECKERLDLLGYYRENAASLSELDLDSILKVCKAQHQLLHASIEDRIAQLTDQANQDHLQLITIFEKGSLLLLRHLQLRLVQTRARNVNDVYSVSRAVSALRTDATTALMPLLEAYHRLCQGSSFADKILQAFSSMLHPSPAEKFY